MVSLSEGDIAIHFNKQGDITYATEVSVSKKLKQIDTTPSYSKENAFEKRAAAHIAGELHIRKMIFMFFLQMKEKLNWCIESLSIFTRHPEIGRLW
jgi:hypothetical protein